MGSQGQGCARWEGLGERTVARAHRGRVAPTHRRRAGQRRGSGCARGRRLARALQEIGVPGGGVRSAGWHARGGAGQEEGLALAAGGNGAALPSPNASTRTSPTTLTHWPLPIISNPDCTANLLIKVDSSFALSSLTVIVHIIARNQCNRGGGATRTTRRAIKRGK